MKDKNYDELEFILNIILRNNLTINLLNILDTLFPIITTCYFLKNRRLMLSIITRKRDPFSSKNRILFFKCHII